MDELLELRVRRLEPDRDADLPLPALMSEHAAGMDIVAANVDPIVIAPGGRAKIPTGLAMAVPPGYEIQVRARSGLAWRHGVCLANGVGTIDADYRGEVGILLINLGAENFEVPRGMRVAQLVVAAVARPHIRLVSTLEGTERGEGGFGHTGKMGSREH